MGLSTYAANALIDLFTRGVAVTPPDRVYISLHTGPSDDGANEVVVGLWPSYARVDLAQGGAIATGFSAADAKATENLKQLLFPAYDGSDPLVISHFAIWDAPIGGNAIWCGGLLADKNLLPTDECVIYPGDIDLSVM
ncbi:phage tail fiber protein [Shinella pollutisoli]|uniref:Uncharacterized protein n=1 Tax=Shinella pollutisoli TaxID=2250594 RepID=A0ABV7DKF4_9HYPH|nr:hypothetical protein [Shinella pollutisoli]